MDMGVPPEQEAAFENYCRGIREKATKEEMERLRKENEELHNLLKDVPTIQIMQKQLADLGSGLCRVFGEIDDLKQKLYRFAYPQELLSDEPPTVARTQRNICI